MTELTFLGTGNFMAPPGRYWNSFVMDTNVLVEPCPTSLPHLRHCGSSVDDIAVVVISHFHADHCFGWPFLLQAMAETGGGRTLDVVGPPGLEQHLAGMMDAGAVRSVLHMAQERLDLRFTEVDGSWQRAGPLRFRAVEVVHVPYLRCFGYLFAAPRRRHRLFGRHDAVRRADRAGPCIRCAGGGVQREAPPAGATPTHMDEDSVRELRAAHPDLHIVLTHLGEQVDTASIPGVTIPSDFERLNL